MPELKAVSFKLDDFVQGGLVTDKDMLIRTLTATTWDYNGKSPETLAVKADIDVFDDNGEVEDQIEHYFSVGDPSDFHAAADGKQILSEEQQLRKGSNWHHFLKSLGDNGFSQDKITPFLTCFEGLGFHGIRAPAPVRPGLKAQHAKGENEFEKTMLVAMATGDHKAIWKMPWEKVKAPPSKKTGPRAIRVSAPAAQSAPPAPNGAPNGAPAATATPAAASNASSEPIEVDLNVEALDTLKKVLAENTPINLDGMKMAAFKVVMKRPTEIRAAIVRLLCDPAWLNEQMVNTNGTVFMFDDAANTVMRAAA